MCKQRHFNIHFWRPRQIRFDSAENEMSIMIIFHSHSPIKLIRHYDLWKMMWRICRWRWLSVQSSAMESPQVKQIAIISQQNTAMSVLFRICVIRWQNCDCAVCSPSDLSGNICWCHARDWCVGNPTNWRKVQNDAYKSNDASACCTSRLPCRSPYPAYRVVIQASFIRANNQS